MKKIISLFLVVTLVLTNFQGWDLLKELDLSMKFDLFQGIGNSFAEEDEIKGTLLEGTGLYYEIENGEVEITDADTNVSGELVVPEMIEGYPVMSIGIGAFYKCEKIKTIKLPESITNIGEYAFGQCTDLETINIPKKVTEIKADTFSSCRALLSINIPDSVKSIGESAFRDCFNLKTVVMPEGIKNIKNRTFYQCSDLESINIPDSVTDIEEYAFYSCHSLKDINLPKGLTHIGEYAFAYCCNLEKIEIPEKMTVIEANTFQSCSSLEKVNIPDNITIIGSSAFDFCYNLEDVQISENVKVIGSYAFDMCSKLKNINIPKGVKTIYTSTFRDCKSLTTIDIPESVTKINSEAFRGCEKLTNIKIPKNVKEIGSFTFSRCKNLTSIEMPNGITKISRGTFLQCINLSNINIPDSVKDIERYAFGYCNSLESITIPEGVSTLEERAFEDCTNLQYVNIPDSVIEIEEDCFYGCGIKSAKLPKNLIKIKSSTFERCTDLEEITIPNKVQIIEDEAFYRCKNLKKIFIPKSVTEIKKDVFFNCDNLTIYGYAGSYAESYAKNNNIPFIEANIKISFDADNGRDKIIQEIEKNTQLNYIPENPTKDGYVFIGWYKDIDDPKTEYKSGSIYEEDTIYTAKWVKIPQISKENIVVNSNSYNSIKIEWKNVDDVDGYEVYRATSELGTYSLRKTVTKDSKLRYINTSVTTGKTYYYKIRAYKIINDKKIYGQYSEIVSGKAVPATPIATAVSKTYNSNQVKWNQVAGANGYEVYRATSENGTYSLRKTITANSSRIYTNTSLTTGKTYYYKVRAYKIVNGNKIYGEFSTVVSAEPMLATPAVTLTTKSKAITVKWTKITGSNGYEVYRATSQNGTYSLTKTISSNSTLSYTNTKLTTGKTYYYKVRAYRVVNGNKVYSNYSQIKYKKCK